MVDGTGADPTHYPSITDAAMVANSGDTILVKGMVDSSGVPVGYSEFQHFPHQQAPNQAERFPIPLKEGVVLKRTGSTPVYVWSTAGAMVTLIDVQEQSGVSGVTTRIESLRLLGASTGIRIHHGLHDSVTVIKDCKFAGLETSVDAKSDGFDTSVAVRDCQIRDDFFMTQSVPPAMQDVTRGYWFQTTGFGSPPGHLVAEVKNHESVGPFASMAGQPWGPLWTGSFDSGTRIIDVQVAGHGTHEYPNVLSGDYSRNRISEVRLDIDGGQFDGHASDGGIGWDTAVLADVHGVGGQDDTYTAGYEITVSGSEMSDFRMSGIIAMAGVTSRGTVQLHGGVSIHDNAPSVTPAGDTHNGVHLIQQEGYLAFLAKNSTIAENAGHGIWMDAKAERLILERPAPEGLYLEMDKVGIHGNGKVGLRGHVGKTHAGVLGGTSHYTFVGEPASWRRNLVDDGESFAIPFGTGLVDSCAISNNGFGGVSMSTEGSLGYVHAYPDEAVETISFRLSNSAVWNNPRGELGIPGHGGLLVSHQGAKGVPKAMVLLPVTHCTMVNNGGPLALGGWTVEFLDDAQDCAYEWARTHESEVLRTAIFNSVFFRDYQTPDPAGNSEFGSSLENILGVYDFNGSGPFPLRGIVMCGLRADTSVLAGALGDDHANKWSHVFAGPLPLVMGSYDPSQFFLTAGTDFNRYYSTTPKFLSAYAPMTVDDIQNQPRATIISGDRDKGVDEL